MKRLLRAIRSATRSDLSARVDALHAESRAEVARKVAEGKGWEGLRENAALLGLNTKDGLKPKMVFGTKR